MAPYATQFTSGSAYTMDTTDNWPKLGHDGQASSEYTDRTLVRREEDGGCGGRRSKRHGCEGEEAAAGRERGSIVHKKSTNGAKTAETARRRGGDGDSDGEAKKSDLIVKR